MSGQAEPPNTEFCACERCKATDPEVAYQALTGASYIHSLLGRSQLDVDVVRCASCRQPWISIYAEFNDFSGGDCPIYRDYVPITESELKSLTSLKDCSYDTVTARVTRLAAGRPRLQADWPQPRWTTSSLSIAPWT